MRLRHWKTLSAAFLLQGLITLPANASSQVVLNQPSPMTANAQIDFTIVIPEILYVGTSARAGSLAGGPEMPPHSSPHASESTETGLPLAMSNAGVLIVGPNSQNRADGFQRDAQNGSGPENIPVGYLVAMP